MKYGGPTAQLLEDSAVGRLGLLWSDGSMG